MNQFSFAAIIFDLDGTLIDTESADFEACQILCQEYGLPLSEAYWAEHVVGHMGGYDFIFSELMRHNGHGLTLNTLRHRLRELWTITLSDVQLRPGVTGLLPALHQAGYPLALATASDRAWVERWFNQFNLWPYFKVIATRENVTHSKPAPDVYLYTAAQLGVAPESCLVFEDSMPGLKAAKAAAMTVVITPSHAIHHLDFSQADELLENLQEISVDWIEQFNRQRTSV